MTYSPKDRVLICLTQLFANIWFGWFKKEDTNADESTSAFVWRKQYKGWIRFVNWLLNDPNHCESAYLSEKRGVQNAPEYRENRQ